MNVMPGVIGAEVALPLANSPLAASNMSVAEQFVQPVPFSMSLHAQEHMPLSEVESSMLAMAESLVQVPDMAIENEMVSADVLESYAPELASMEESNDLAVMHELPAMQLPWGWQQAAIQRQAVIAPAAQVQQDFDTAAVVGVDSAARGATSFTTAVKNLAQFAQGQALPSEVSAAPAEQMMPLLNVSSRGSQEALRSAANASPVLVSNDTLPVHKGSKALVQALADRVQVQQLQGAQIATVRLDPPQMGSLEIRIRQDAAGVHVQMQASHAEVGRQLATVADSLRQELLARSHDAQVTVSHSRSMSSGGQSDAQRHSQSEAEDVQVGQALQDIERDGALT